MLKFQIECFFLSVFFREQSWINPQLNQLIFDFLPQHIRQSLQLSLNVARPLEVLLSVLRQDVYFNEVFESLEESDAPEK